jgi:hypothetical protein
LLVLNVPDTSHYLNLEEFVENSRKAATAEWVSEQGRKMAAIKLFFEHSEEPPHAWNVTIYTDPDVNYLVRKVVYASSGKVEYRREEEVIEFKDGGGGVFFPESTVGRSENGGKPYSSLQCQVKDIRINESLPQDAFRLRYPRGTQLNDNIRGVTYTVDEDGRQISKESAQNRGPQAAPAAFPASPMTETREEPAGIGRWILIAFLAVGLIGLVVIVLRHRMRQVSS